MICGIAPYLYVVLRAVPDDLLSRLVMTFESVASSARTGQTLGYYRFDLNVSTARSKCKCISVVACCSKLIANSR